MILRVLFLVFFLFAHFIVAVRNLLSLARKEHPKTAQYSIVSTRLLLVCRQVCVVHSLIKRVLCPDDWQLDQQFARIVSRFLKQVSSHGSDI